MISLNVLVLAIEYGKKTIVIDWYLKPLKFRSGIFRDYVANTIK